MILTDIGGVVLLPNPALWDELTRRGAPPNVEQCFFGVGSPWERLRVGKISFEEYVSTLSEEVLVPKDVVADLLERVQWTVNASMARWLDAMSQQGISVVAVSNADMTLEAQLQRQHLLPLFSDIVNSSRVGFAKPDREIYEIAVQRAGVAPSECLFIDDKASNLAVATELGIPAILYQDFARFTDEVRGWLQ